MVQRMARVKGKGREFGGTDTPSTMEIELADAPIDTENI